MATFWLSPATSFLLEWPREGLCGLVRNQTLRSRLADHEHCPHLHVRCAARLWLVVSRRADLASLEFPAPSAYCVSETCEMKHPPISTTYPGTPQSPASSSIGPQTRPSRTARVYHDAGGSGTVGCTAGTSMYKVGRVLYYPGRE